MTTPDADPIAPLPQHFLVEDGSAIVQVNDVAGMFTGSGQAGSLLLTHKQPHWPGIVRETRTGLLHLDNSAFWVGQMTLHQAGLAGSYQNGLGRSLFGYKEDEPVDLKLGVSGRPSNTPDTFGILSADERDFGIKIRRVNPEIDFETSMPPSQPVDILSIVSTEGFPLDDPTADPVRYTTAFAKVFLRTFQYVSGMQQIPHKDDIGLPLQIYANGPPAGLRVRMHRRYGGKDRVRPANMNERFYFVNGDKTRELAQRKEAWEAAKLEKQDKLQVVRPQPDKFSLINFLLHGGFEPKHKVKPSSKYEPLKPKASDTEEDTDTE